MLFVSVSSFVLERGWRNEETVKGAAKGLEEGEAARFAGDCSGAFSFWIV